MAPDVHPTQRRMRQFVREVQRRCRQLPRAAAWARLSPPLPARLKLQLVSINEIGQFRMVLKRRALDPRQLSRFHRALIYHDIRFAGDPGAKDDAVRPRRVVIKDDAQRLARRVTFCSGHIGRNSHSRAAIVEQVHRRQWPADLDRRPSAAKDLGIGNGDSVGPRFGKVPNDGLEKRQPKTSRAVPCPGVLRVTRIAESAAARTTTQWGKPPARSVGARAAPSPVKMMPDPAGKFGVNEKVLPGQKIEHRMMSGARAGQLPFRNTQHPVRSACAHRLDPGLTVQAVMV